MPSYATINYLLAPRGYFWAWSDDCAIEWEDGSTIAIFEEVEAILEKIHPLGLPPLGSIVLILAACSDSWHQRWKQVWHLAAASTGEIKPLNTVERLLYPVEAALNRIRELPQDLRRGTNARCALIEAIFEGVFNRLPRAVAEEIVSDLRREGLGFRRTNEPVLGIHMRLLRDLSALDAAFAKLDMTRLEERLRTGLDVRTVEPAPLPKIDPSKVGDLPLLEQLAQQGDAELSAIAALAQRVVAMISVPRVAGQLRALPCGGVSDISNRGELTRMLLSELAWDDEMFSARLAHNETLFYQREVPPDAPKSLRSILLDHGIRLWGLPRLYALAVALALSKQAEGTEVEVWRREDAEFSQIPLLTVRDVQSHLAALSPSVSTAEALDAWEPAPDKAKQHDVFLITTRENLERSEVIESLQAWFARTRGSLRLFTISIDREGNLELAMRTATGTRELAKCRLDLDVFLPQPAARPTTSATPLPSRKLYQVDQKIAKLAFFQQWPLPISFLAKPDRDSNTAHSAWNKCMVAVDERCRLMAWPAWNKPATELGAGLPVARQYWVDSTPGAFIPVICSARSPGDTVKLCRVHLRAEPPDVIELQAKHSFPGNVTFEHGAAIIHYMKGAEAFSLATGQRVAELTFPAGSEKKRVTFDGATLLQKTDPPAASTQTIEQGRDTKALELPEVTAPKAIGLVDGKLALQWENQLKIWSAMGKRFEKFNRRVTLRSETRFSQVPGTSPGKNTIPAYWHAHSTAADFYYDSRGLLHIVTEEAEVTLPVYSEIATEVWTNPPMVGRKTIAEVENRLQVLSALY